MKSVTAMPKRIKDKDAEKTFFSFFTRFLLFELLSISYSTVVNSELELHEKSGRDFCEPNSDTNKIRVIKPKACRIQEPRVQPLSGCGAKLPTKKNSQISGILECIKGKNKNKKL